MPTPKTRLGRRAWQAMAIAPGTFSTRMTIGHTITHSRADARPPGIEEIPGFKTSLLQLHPRGRLQTSHGRSPGTIVCGQAQQPFDPDRRSSDKPKPVPNTRSQTCRSSRTGNRIESLFTMLNHLSMRSSEPHPATAHPRGRSAAPNSCASTQDRGHACLCRRSHPGMVELDGFEPTTSCLQSRRSPS